MSSPRAKQLQDLFDSFLASTAGDAPRDVAESLGVDTTYVSKLRAGWRPTRVRDELWNRLNELESRRRVPAEAARGPEFYDGILFAAQAYSETQARLIATARAGLAATTGTPVPLTPSAAAIADGVAALRQAPPLPKAQQGKKKQA